MPRDRTAEGNARSAHPAEPARRAAPRRRGGAADRAADARPVPRRPWLALSRAPPAGGEGLAPRRVGGVREQPPGEVLHAHQRRPAPAQGRNAELGARLRGHPARRAAAILRSSRHECPRAIPQPRSQPVLARSRGPAARRRDPPRTGRPTEEKLASGLAPAEARRAAMMESAGPTS